MTDDRCQSCGMPLRRDRSRSGNADYCSHCWQDGAFTMPDVTLEEMQRRVRARLAELGIPASEADRIPTLKRWRRK